MPGLGISALEQPWQGGSRQAGRAGLSTQLLYKEVKKSQLEMQRRWIWESKPGAGASYIPNMPEDRVPKRSSSIQIISIRT